MGEGLVRRCVAEERVKGVAMDMHEAFRQAVQMCLPWAEVVVDKFHLIRHINGALDKVRSRVINFTLIDVEPRQFDY